ncbi:MAG TPA: hypothetical protein PK402_14555 [Tepidisphaeraceae bacterium]|nr:hypothetical protein [Tepidisphaeraceae bacterium]
MLRQSLIALAFACSLMPILPATSIAFADEPAADSKEEKKPVEPVDFRELKKFLPEAVGGVSRSEASGSKTASGGMKITEANGHYSKEGSDSSAEVVIIDYGAMPEMAAAVGSASGMDIDTESDDEYMRTVKYGEHRGIESYNSKEKSGSLQLFVAGRFFVTISIEHLEPTEFANTVAAMKLDDLAALAKK